MKRLSFDISTTIGILALAGAIVTAQAPAGQAGAQAPAGQAGAPAQGGAGRAGGGGRAGGPQLPHQNTQILDRNMPTPQLIQIMQNFTAALGVTCNHCHVFMGGGNPMNDFVTDNKQPKKTARTMMLMTRDLNAKLGAELGKPASDVTQVQCVTCHRGVAIPKQLVDIVAATTTAKGAAAAVTEYRDLRRQFYGSQSYDFREDSLLTAAQRATADSRPDDALVFLNANVELFPMGARSYQAMSVAYQRKNDRENAIKSLQKAVELDPMNAGYKTQLTNLQNPPAPAAN